MLRSIANLKFRLGKEADGWCYVGKGSGLPVLEAARQADLQEAWQASC